MNEARSTSNAPARVGDPGGRLTGVGVGPGDPGLITRRAIEVLTRADRVTAPVTPGQEPGRAESVVRAVLPDIPITRLAFEMTRDASHETVAKSIMAWLHAGEHVAFVTLGDPAIYSTFPALVDALRALGCAAQVDTVPGITAFQELAARSATVLLDGTESMSLVTALDGTVHVAAALSDPTRAVVVYKGGRYLPEIAALLAQHGRLEGAVFGERLGLPTERICPVADAAGSPASYLATVIVPPADSR